MGNNTRYVYVLTLNDLVIFVGSNLKVVYQFYKNKWAIEDLQKFKSYEQYSRDILKKPTILFPNPFYGNHKVSKFPLLSNLKIYENGINN